LEVVHQPLFLRVLTRHDHDRPGTLGWSVPLRLAAINKMELVHKLKAMEGLSLFNRGEVEGFIRVDKHILFTVIL
jgi:hypothetical protein